MEKDLNNFSGFIGGKNSCSLSKIVAVRAQDFLQTQKE